MVIADADLPLGQSVPEHRERRQRRSTDERLRDGVGVQAFDRKIAERIRAQAQEITGRIEHGLREGSRRMILTRDLPDVLTGPAEVIDARTLRYIDTDLTVRLVGVDICAPDQKVTFAGTPWPCANMATAWLVSQTLGRDLQCQRLGRQFDGIINARCAIEGADIAG